MNCVGTHLIFSLLRIAKQISFVVCPAVRKCAGPIVQLQQPLKGSFSASFLLLHFLSHEMVSALF